MKNISIILLSIFILAACGRENSQQALLLNSSIVGGEPVQDFREFPFIISLSNSEIKHYCGGTLISPDWVITAGHCLLNKSLEISTGSLDKRKHPIKVRVIDSVLHPDYHVNELGVPVNDIMLLKIERVPEIEALDFDAIELPTKDVEVGTMATIMGWGSLCENIFCQFTPPDELQAVEVPIVANRKAQQKNSYGDNFDADAMLAAGYARGGKDSCQGDSGGPLIVQDGAKHILVGVVSAGRGCAQANYYGIYTRMTSYFDWIAETISQ